MKHYPTPITVQRKYSHELTATSNAALTQPIFEVEWEHGGGHEVVRVQVPSLGVKCETMGREAKVHR